MNSRRTTLKDLAQRLNVSKTTIFLALRNHPSIPSTTRDKVHRLAARLKYFPDPMLSALAAYRKTTRRTSFRGVLAWVDNFEQEGKWRDHPQNIEIYESGKKRAMELGYHLEPFWLGQPGLSPSRASEILLARGIQGLILAPQPQPYAEVDLRWEHFSVVTIGHTLQKPEFHMVANHMHYSASLAVRELFKCGYRRIGFVIEHLRDLKSDKNYRAGYLVEVESEPKLKKLEVHLPDVLDLNHLSKWFYEQRPDVVLTIHPQVLPLLEQMKLQIPRDVGFALLIGGNRKIAGVDQKVDLIGSTAAEFISSLIHQNERGIPHFPKQIFLRSRWVRGSTISCH